MARIAVIGPGAMGCLFAARLALAGHDVGLVCRRPAQAAELERDGLVVERDGQEQRTGIWATVATCPVAPADFGLVMVKSFDTLEAGAAIAPLLAADGYLLTLQNGLGNAERLASVVGSRRVLAGVTSQGATLLGPGRVRHAGFGPTQVTELAGGAGERARAISALLSAAGIPTEPAAELGPLVWSKLVVNVAVNPLTALTGLRNGELLDAPESLGLLDALAREAAAVARALGVSLPFDDPVQHARRIAELTRPNRSSMLQDVERRRRTEIEAINGALLELAIRYNVPVPTNAVVLRLLRSLERRYLAERRAECDTEPRNGA